jgi:2-dehydropantoate 2-reductase
MKICVFGMGAVGGHFGARLAAAGHEVSAVARGENLAALRRDGIALHSNGDTIAAPVHASENTRDLGPQDVVISTLKATGLQDLAASVAPLLGADTPVIFAQNGIPWWYDMGLSDDRPAPPELTSVDPGGALRRAISPERVIGGVINSPNEMIAPGVVRHTGTRQSALSIGEPDDSHSARIAELRAVLEGAGIKSDRIADIRQTIWSKLVINMTASPLSLLTGHKVSVIRNEPRIRAIYPRVAREAMAVAAAHGISLDFDPEAQIQRAPDHTPSIRQDYELGRPMELESLLLVPLSFGAVAGVDTPCLDIIAALAAVEAQDKGLYAP